MEEPRVIVGSEPPLIFAALSLLFGVVSAFATSFASRYLDPLNPLTGAIFGVVVTLMLWVRYKRSSVWMAIACTSTAVLAYLVSIWGTAYVITRGFPLLGEAFLAGFIGAFIINISLLVLTSSGNGLRALGRSAAWACGGAVLGTVSSAFEEPVGRAVRTIVRGDSTEHWGNLDIAFYSAYLIWQTGMAILIPWMLSHGSISRETSATVPRSPAQLSTFGKALLAVFLVGVGVITYKVAKDKSQRSESRREAERMWQEMPAADNLPAIEMRPPEDVLIDRVGGFRESGAGASRFPAHALNVGPVGSSYRWAESVVYTARYSPEQTEPSSRYRPQPSAIVTEFPNAEWAQYKLRYSPCGIQTPSHPQSKKTDQFRSPVLVYPDTASSDKCVYWRHDNKLIAVLYSGEDADEIVKEYLNKYPSSL